MKSELPQEDGVPEEASTDPDKDEALGKKDPVLDSDDSQAPKRARSVLNGAYWETVCTGRRREAAWEAREKIQQQEERQASILLEPEPEPEPDPDPDPEQRAPESAPGLVALRLALTRQQERLPLQ